MRCCCSVCSRAIERNFSLRFKGNGKKYGHVKQRHREGTPCSNIRHRVGGTKGPTNICLTIKYAKLIYFDPILTYSKSFQMSNDVTNRCKIMVQSYTGFASTPDECNYTRT